MPVGDFNSQFVPNKQYNVFYSNSFWKLNMSVEASVKCHCNMPIKYASVIKYVSSGSFLIFMYVFMDLLVPNDLPYIFLLKSDSHV